MSQSRFLPPVLVGFGLAMCGLLLMLPFFSDRSSPWALALLSVLWIVVAVIRRYSFRAGWWEFAGWMFLSAASVLLNIEIRKVGASDAPASLVFPLVLVIASAGAHLSGLYSRPKRSEHDRRVEGRKV
jgi:hypothetical protein